MFNEINHLLNLSGDSRLAGEHILISDLTNDDGSFLVHHFLSYFLKTDQQKQVFFVSFAQSFNHFQCVAQKFGLNLRQLRDSGSLVFIEALKDLGKAVTEPEDCNNPLTSALSHGKLKEFFLHLKSHMDNSPQDQNLKPVVILDNLAVLLSLGVPLAQLTALCQSLQSVVCRERHGSLVVHLNIAEEDDREQLLLRHLFHTCDCHLQVTGLPTGYCKDVHGELAVTWRQLIPSSNHQSKTMQFKLSEKNVSFFASGMSQAVL